MIFFVGNDGTIIKSFPEYVYQGSANTNTIYLIAPFAVNSQVTVAFQLPNGTWTSPVAMTQQQALQNIVNKETGQTYAGWTYALPNNITQNFGVLTVQFFFYSASAGVITATSSAKLTVAKGVPSVLPETPSEDVYEAILSNIAALQEQLNNGTFVARSIYAWNSTYTYGANEITFYPSIGDYGAFVQSLQTGNTNHQPYDSDGALNSTWWKEVVNFNTITEDFFDEIKEQADLATTAAQNAATSEASAAQSASAAAASESAAETAATTATGAAASAEKDAETASTSANAAAASANASAASASQSNNSAIAANNSAIAAANSAARIEDMKTTFALKDESASSLEVSLNNATFVLTMTLKDINGNTLSTQTVDFPIESMVVGISYNEATKTLIFQLQSGSTIEVPIDDIVDGLATQTALDNVINGTTPVAKATAADTAGQVDNALTVITDGVSRQYNGSEPVTVTINTTSSTDPESVHFTSQTLNDSQQTQARENIGAASVAEMNAGDDKSYYNLGAYDTYVDNGDGTVTVTRKTGYVVINGTEPWNPWVGTSTVTNKQYYLSKTENRMPSKLSPMLGAESFKNNRNYNIVTFTIFNNDTNNLMGVTNNEVQINIPASADVNDYLSQNPIYIQYELSTSYTEDVILDQPIHTLDVNGEQFVRDEWEKTLNLYNHNNVSDFSGNVDASDFEDGTIDVDWGGAVSNATINFNAKNGATFSCSLNSASGGYWAYNMTWLYKDGSSEQMTTNQQVGTSGKFTFSSAAKEVIGIRLFVNLTWSASNVMINEGSHAYPYQPYNGAIVHEKQLNDALEDYPTNDELNTKLEDYLPLTGGTINGTINATGQVQEAGQRVYSPNNKPTKSDIGLGNVDNVQQYSSQNPPPYPVTSVNGMTGDVNIRQYEHHIVMVSPSTITSGNRGRAFFTIRNNFPNAYLTTSQVRGALYELGATGINNAIIASGYIQQVVSGVSGHIQGVYAKTGDILFIWNELNTNDQDISNATIYDTVVEV